MYFILYAKKHSAIQFEDAACFELGLFLISCLNSVEYGQSDVPRLVPLTLKPHMMMEDASALGCLYFHLSQHYCLWCKEKIQAIQVWSGDLLHTAILTFSLRSLIHKH